MHNADMVEAAEIKEMREALGESQAVFGARFGVDQSTVDRWENKPPKRGPALLALQRLRDELNSAKHPEAAE